MHFMHTIMAVDKWSFPVTALIRSESECQNLISNLSAASAHLLDLVNIQTLRQRKSSDSTGVRSIERQPDR